MPRDRARPVLPVVLLGLLLAARAAVGAGADPPEVIPPEEYAVYDLVITRTFLTSRTQLVLIRRRTATRLGPFAAEPPSPEFFLRNDLFTTSLPPDLLRDFAFKMRRPSRLEPNLRLGVPYRLVAGEGEREPEVSLAPIPARLAQGPRPEGPLSTVGVLELSRVGFNFREDQALVYAGIDRPDGTGAGFLFRLAREGLDWRVVETEVLWMARP